MKIELLEYPTEKDWMEVKRRALVTVGKRPVEAWREESMTPLEYIYRERSRARLNLKWSRGRNDAPAMRRLEERLQILDELERGLKPTVTREQVEKAWKAEPEERYGPYHLLVWTACPRCGREFIDEWPENFCPQCGNAFIDEAVDIVMERLNKLASEEWN